MTSQGLRALGRVALGVVTITAGVMLLAPAASASPESDAEDAITAAWEKAGGDHSMLGAKQGNVYPVGDGFAQNFDGGKMFFTPGTGARSLYGAVLDKYESLGGPAGSDLGFPTINEVPGLAGPDSRASTFSASDSPVIFWTPDHGAYVVRGAMNAAWDALGSSGGVLGVPVGDETYDGEMATQPFTGGRVSWNRVTKVFSTVPPDLAQQLTGVQVPIDPTAAIDMAWRAAGGQSGPLGAKEGGQYPIGNDKGLAQNFVGGKVFFSFDTGANGLDGPILAKYESLGGPVGSDLGFPIANEADGGIAPKSRVSMFSAADKPEIFWTSRHGAFVVRGAMRAAWDKLGGPKGKLGAPVEDQSAYGDVISQKFTGGKIAWNRAKNTFSTEPANLASALSGLQVPGQHLPARVTQPSPGIGQAWHRWLWWLAGIPALLLIWILALIVRQWRRRRIAGPAEAMAEKPDRDLEPGYGAVPYTARPSSDGAEEELEPEAFSSDYPEPAGHPDLPNPPDADWMAPAAVDEWPPTDEIPSGAAPSEFDEGVDVENPDVVDTAPTRVPSAAEVRDGGRHAADSDDEPDASLPAHPTIHLPLDDPHQPPDGYPVKGNASFGLYYTPESELYDDAFAEIWFASEEIARVNGFTKGE